MSDELQVSTTLRQNAEQLFADGKAESRDSSEVTLTALADIRVVLPDVELDRSEFSSVAKELQQVFQEIADQDFGKGSVDVRIQLISGSLAIIVTIAVAAYTGIKEYPDFKKGLETFVSDVKKAGKAIRSKIQNRKRRK